MLVEFRSRNGVLEYQPLTLGPELYLACEELYLTLDLPSMIKEVVQSLDNTTRRKLLSNILLTGGNCRLTGLSVRLTKDLKRVILMIRCMLVEINKHFVY